MEALQFATITKCATDTRVVEVLVTSTGASRTPQRVPTKASSDRVDYCFAAASCFMLVWKIASHALFSFFQTEPAL